MGVAELETVVRLGLPMVVVVYNDEAYGAEVHHFGPHGHPLDTVRFPDTDLAAIARGYGFAAVTVTGPGDLAAVAEWLQAPRDRPLLVDAKVAREARLVVAGGGVPGPLSLRFGGRMSLRMVRASSAAARTAARGAPALAVTAAAIAPSTNGTSATTTRPGSASSRAVSTELPRSGTSTTPSPWSTAVSARSIRSRLVPTPPSSVPPAAATARARPGDAADERGRLLRQSGAVGHQHDAHHQELLTSTMPTISEPALIGPTITRRGCTVARQATMSADDAAPGSWCPTLRSPR